MVTTEDNSTLVQYHNMEEVKHTIFSLKRSSSYNLDGFSSLFYQHYWEIVKQDVYRIVKEFFEGNTSLKSVTHTSLVLILKKKIVEGFSDRRPISLSNFINKVVSKVLHMRIEDMLTMMISKN